MSKVTQDGRYVNDQQLSSCVKIQTSLKKTKKTNKTKTLFGPSSQISVARVLKAFNVRGQFFVHVLQTGNEKDQGRNKYITNCFEDRKCASLK